MTAIARIGVAMLVFYLGSLHHALGATIPAASCSASDVQAAIDSAANGDTVTIPAGRCTWTAIVSIPDSKGITLRGAGIDTTTIVSGVNSVGTIRSLSVDVAPGNALTRITNFTIDAGTRSGGWGEQIWLYGEGIDRFRLDHLKITNILVRGILIVAGPQGGATGAELSGLVDHNIIECPANAACQSISVVASPAFDPNNPSSAAWGAPFSRPVEFGSNKAIYFEDNIFNFAFPNDGCIDNYGGVQFVWRFNTMNGCAPGWHGNDSAGYRGGHWVELYRNQATHNASTLAVIRSNTGFIFDNTHTTPGSWIKYALTIFRARPETFFARIGQCDGTSPYDGNRGSGGNVKLSYPATTSGNSGWPCIDQPGWVFDADGGAGFQSYPLYFFGERNNGAAAGISNYETAAANIANYLQPNRDFYDEVTTFNGSSGVGRGPLAARPASCIAGVGYWATDQGNWNVVGEDGVFYKCTSTDTWTLYYTPYQYPHPLALGGPESSPTPAPPTNLKIVPPGAQWN